MKQPFEKCPVCGDDLIKKKVEKLVRGGDDTATLHVPAYVCHGCGERIYDQKIVRLFEEVRSKLERRQTHGFKSLGKLFQVKAI